VKRRNDNPEVERQTEPSNTLLTCGLLTLSERSERKGVHLFTCSKGAAKRRSLLYNAPLPYHRTPDQKKGYEMAFMFENLDVYQKSVDFIDQITTLTREFPRGYYFLTDQLNRASLSIATNLAEGNGRFTKNDRRNFFIIARGSVQECIPLLEIVRRKGLIEESVVSGCRDQLEVIAKMISGLINGLKKRKK